MPQDGLNSTSKLVPLLRPWLNGFTMIISAWWLQTKQQMNMGTSQRINRKTWKETTPKRVRNRPKYDTTIALS